MTEKTVIKVPDEGDPRAFAVDAPEGKKLKPGRKSSKKESNPLDKAMDILDGYYKGTPPMELKGCGCCENEPENSDDGK